MKSVRMALLIAFVLCFSMLSLTVSAAASLQVSSDSPGKQATTDDPAEYTITVTNDGDEDLTVQLQASQDNDCNGFTSQIDQAPFGLNSGQSETATLTVSVNDQADGDCETTVTANGWGSNPSDNAQADVKVTTSSEGGGQYSVTLTHSNPSNGMVNYDGEDNDVEWEVLVENTGEADNEQIQLSMGSSGSCDPEGLDAAVEPATMTLNSGDTETATVTVSLPDGSSTEAGDHCFVLEATVTNDPNPADQANDSVELRLKIPDVKTCESDLQFNSHSLDPGESASNSVTIRNSGNTAWTVTVFATASGEDVSDWFSFETPTSRLLEKPQEAGDQTIFAFVITPDDSVEPGQIDVYIQGRSGASLGCESLLRVTLGQVRDAALSLSSTSMNNVNPGATGITSLLVTNTGNGQDTFALGVKELIPGWIVELEYTVVTIDGKHCSSTTTCDRLYVEAQVTVPADAKAEVEYSVIFTVSSSGSQRDEVSLTVTVAPVHSGSIYIPSNSQTGKNWTWVDFPVEITNTGNIRDTFVLESCDPNVNDSCQSTVWPTRFKDTSGNEISQTAIDSDDSKMVIYQIYVSDSINNLSEDFEIRIGIVGASFSVSKVVTITVSIYDYSMAVAFAEPGDDPGTMSLSLPPGGASSVSFVVTNTGNGGSDDAVIYISGMDSTVLKRVTVDGSEIGDSIKIPAEGSVTLEIEFDAQDVESGTSGVIRIGTTSKKNTGQTPSFVDLSVSISAIHDLELTLETPSKVAERYPGNVEFVLFVTNNGNVEEDVEVIASDSLRGWSVDVISDEFKLAPGGTREIKIRATPPSELISDDEYKFTITVRPKDMPVAGEPIDLIAESTRSSGSFSQDTITLIAASTILLGSMGIIALFIRFRSSTKLFEE